MTKQPRTKADPIEQEIELALNPGAFIPDRACYSFVSDLDEVAAKIAKLTASDPSRAVTLYETFLAASYSKVEELDDSSGSFGQFVDELCCGWIKARQAEGANPDETASRLLAWMDDDEYGFCAALSNFESAKRCFERAGLHAEWQKTVSQVRADHHRKSGFMSGFERLVEGTGPSDEPSFMELAKARWGERYRRAR
jgi:hypothetical protein